MPDKKTTKAAVSVTPGDAHWATDTAAHDHTAATDYLSLAAAPELASMLADELLRAPVAARRANDLLRASGLALLARTDSRVAKNLKKLKRGEKLRPVLLVRGDVRTGRPLVVADGYHRICASYHINEDTDIPCRIVDLPAATPEAAAAKPPARRPATRRPATTEPSS